MGEDGHLEAVKAVVRPQKINPLKNLVYGGIAGVAGSLTTFPIDTAKTRLQEQVSAKGTVKQYSSIFDCWMKMVRAEGPFSLYRGLPVQLIGIVPEKALKLTINDFVRYITRNPDGTIDLWAEGLAGLCAATGQVVVTSPMEMLKIRMQMMNRLPVEQRSSITQLAKTIVSGGRTSIYNGAASTLLRDAVFSVLYFPAYSRLKLWMANQPQSSPFRRPDTDADPLVDRRVGLLGAFVAGTVAGSMSAVLTTPADVVKTRIQKDGGLAVYKNIPTCFRMTYAEGGLQALFKGASGRFMLIGPLFGVVLATYELMPRVLPL
eukprot:CAMPEP_0177636556 /NCGR_PEP_ID=MMETSP0447-20121125/4501_1 /TAXON_ID=0 /ORGANISM="Stygamoeba regulata, Strain BSH-02190019" /LENGTH=318 /DNA_ID=CAMNT_0019138425 /DNA_START=101 /DNA_END=1057 /DNA_ORIENTATION=+